VGARERLQHCSIQVSRGGRREGETDISAYTPELASFAGLHVRLHQNTTIATSVATLTLELGFRGK